MKFLHCKNLGEAIPRRSKIGLLLFNHAYFIGESDRMGTQIVIFSWQHDPSKMTGWKRTWFKIIRPSYYGA